MGELGESDGEGEGEGDGTELNEAEPHVRDVINLGIQSFGSMWSWRGYNRIVGSFSGSSESFGVAGGGALAARSTPLRRASSCVDEDTSTRTRIFGS